MASIVPITGRTVVVTGGSRGVGLGLVKKFLAGDNQVIATTRKAGEAKFLHELKQQYDAKLQISELDVSQASSIEQWSTRLKQDVQHIDVSDSRPAASFSTLFSVVMLLLNLTIETCFVRATQRHTCTCTDVFHSSPTDVTIQRTIIRSAVGIVAFR